MPRQISRETARRFLATRHLLAPPRSLPPTTDSVMLVVDRLGSLQFDPLGVAGRNHDLVLQARIAGYRRELTDELLYGSRRLFETYNKSLNLLPTRELPHYRVSWEHGLAGNAAQLVAAQRTLADKILAEIRAEGPKCSLDFEREAAIDWWWGPTTAVRAVLEALSVCGTIGLARRDGNRRYYDLTERLYPPELLAERVPERDQMRHKLLSRYRGHGLLAATGPGELWIGTDKPPLRTELRKELLDAGALVPVSVDGLRGERFVVASELPILDAAERAIAAGAPPGGAAPGVTFLAPLDPLMWDRSLLGPLWGFDYIWEVYTPARKRRWGYYVLPLLFGDRIVGRMEPRLDRRARVARVLGLSFEDGFDPMAEPGFIESFADALNAYLAFGGVTAVERSGAVAAGPTRALFRVVASRVPMKRAIPAAAPAARSAAAGGRSPAASAKPAAAP